MSIFDSASKKIHNLLGMTALGQKTKATALGVTLCSDEDALAVTDNAGSLTVDDGAGSLTVDSPGIPAGLGQTTMAASMSVAMANNQTAIPQSVASGANVTEGAVADAAVDTDTTGTLSGKLRGLVKLAVNYLTRFPAALGQGTMAQSLPVAIASNQSSVPVTDNAGSLTMDSPQLPAALGQGTMAQSMTVVLASNQTTLFFAASTVVQSFLGSNIGVNTTPYSVGDVLGTKQQLTTIVPSNDKTGCMLETIVITDNAMQRADLEVLIFRANPTASTLTNNVEASIHDDDLPNIIGRFDVVGSDYVDYATKSIATIYPKAMLISEASPQEFYFVLVIRGAHTYTGNALGITFIATV
jgi:hypothetical protein